MRPVEIKPDIYWVGVNDRSTDLFEGLWPIHQEGVSYNAYLIKDKKNALIDMSKEIFTDDFAEQISALTEPKDLDYIIVNHMEPDHTGALCRLRALAPNAKFLGMQKAVSMMNDFYGLTENTQVVKHEETLSLGKFTLKFLYTPGVHWPETMMTYVQEEELLFTCDAFGSYGALDGFIFDDECQNLAFYEKEALRYYTNIVAAFSRNVLMAIDKVAAYPIKIIAPSHGLVWRKDPMRIVSLYKTWAEYAKGPAQPGITVLYGSMYRNTERALDQILQVIGRQKLPLQVFNVSVTDPSYYLPSMWAKQGLLVACPTYERAMFPAMVRALNMAEIKDVKNKTAAYFGSFAWSGGAKEVFEGFAERLSWDVVGAYQFAGSAKENDLQQIQQICEKLVSKTLKP
ncbi:MAG: FprA family A-type flavoprotein [Anaerolineaceae bacterium]|nr:FprA family A-type flavoprotein [Anaerolineaceae bacterium]